MFIFKANINMKTDCNEESSSVIEILKEESCNLITFSSEKK